MAETLVQRIRSNAHPFLPVAVLYFFLNCLFLPEGLQYTTLLTPLFLWWLVRDKTIKPFIIFGAITVGYAAIHFYLGVQPVYYMRSWALAFCSFTFALAVYKFLATNQHPEKLLEQIAWLNLILIPIAIITLILPPLNEYFWYYKPISPGIRSFPRLSMLTYEASYYALLFTPVLFLFLLRFLLKTPKKPIQVVLLVVLPIALSLSFGAILITSITLTIIFLLNLQQILNTRKKKVWFIGATVALIILSICILFIFPDNVIAHRISNAMNYKDTSLRGRTNEAFEIAWQIACAKSAWFGVGFGQIKVVGHDIYFNFYKFTHPVIRIPNTCAENLAMFGITGLALRFALEFWFFFKTGVYKNTYRLAIFIFAFLYQLQGSFMFNIAELVLWVIAFTPAFHEFDQTPKTVS